MLQTNLLKNLLRMFSALLFLLTLSAQAHGAVDMFLKVEGIDGESADANHKNWIDIQSYTHGVSIPVSLGLTDRTAGTATFEDLVVTKFLDRSTPQLLLRTADGRRINEAVFVLADAAGEQAEFYRITLNDVMVAAVSQGGSGGTQPGESVGLAYSKITWEYIPTGGTGGGGGGTSCKIVFASDVDVDCDVDGLDLYRFARDFMKAQPAADLNRDGIWDQKDLEIFARDFGGKP